MTAPTSNLWGLTDHVCIACLGRVLERKWPPSAPKVYRCSNCGAEAEAAAGRGAAPICACNAKLGKKDAGIRCVRNDRQRPELLCEVVAREMP